MIFTLEVPTETAAMLELSFKFEECRPRPTSAIQQFVRGFVGVMQTNPTLIPQFSFGRAESMSSGLVDVDTGRWSPPTPQGNEQRLVLVEHAGKPLLRFLYDEEGWLIETEFPGHHAERYAHDSEGRVNAVQWDGQTTAAFAYHKHGGLASIRYADGSMFYYQAGSTGLCDSWRYPDGVECFVERDKHGRLETLSCGAVTVHYVWASGDRLRTIATATSDGVSRIELNGRRLALPFEEQSPNRRGHRMVRSAIGLWTLRAQGVPSELISPFTARVCLMSDPIGRTTTRWSPSGRTVWAFNDRGLLDGVTAIDGTRTVFLPADDLGHVFALSARGVDVFRYVGGHLAMTRSMDGSFTRLTYAAAGSLSQIESPRVTHQFQCDADGHLAGLSSPTLFRVRDLDALTSAGTIHLLLGSADDAEYIALDSITSWLCNWQGFRQRNRLDQNPEPL